MLLTLREFEDNQFSIVLTFIRALKCYTLGKYGVKWLLFLFFYKFKTDPINSESLKKDVILVVLHISFRLTKRIYCNFVDL